MSFILLGLGLRKGTRMSFSGSSSHSVMRSLALGWWHDASTADRHTHAHRHTHTCIDLCNYVRIYISVVAEKCLICVPVS